MALCPAKTDKMRTFISNRAKEVKALQVQPIFHQWNEVIMIEDAVRVVYTNDKCRQLANPQHICMHEMSDVLKRTLTVKDKSNVTRCKYHHIFYNIK